MSNSQNQAPPTSRRALLGAVTLPCTIALQAHDRHITGLDVNPGYGPPDLSGPSFSGAAAAPAQALRPE